MNKVRTRRQNTSKNRKKRNTRNNRNTRNTRKRKVSIKRRRVKSKRRVSSLKGGAFCGSRPGGSRPGDSRRGRPRRAARQGFVEMSDNDKQKTLAEVERKIQEGTDSYMKGWTHTKDDYAAFIGWLKDNEQAVLDNYDCMIHDEISKKFAEKREWAEYMRQEAIDQAAASLR